MFALPGQVLWGLSVLARFRSLKLDERALIDPGIRQLTCTMIDSCCLISSANSFAPAPPQSYDSKRFSFIDYFFKVGNKMKQRKWYTKVSKLTTVQRSDWSRKPTLIRSWKFPVTGMCLCLRQCMCMCLFLLLCCAHTTHCGWRLGIIASNNIIHVDFPQHLTDLWLAHLIPVSQICVISCFQFGVGRKANVSIIFLHHMASLTQTVNDHALCLISFGRNLLKCMNRILV